jgi:Bacterial lectin
MRVGNRGSKELFARACIVTFTLLVGTITGWAQCTAPPNYSPDFSGPSTAFPNASSQACLTLNGINYNSPSTAYPGFYPVAPPPPTPPPNVSTVLRLTPNQQAWTGSAWYQTQQPVAGAFSTTFKFQLTGASGDGPGDGFAFVIQNSSPGVNSGVNAIGPEGCGIGFGTSLTGCVPPYGPQTGIPNSLAIEFNTFQNYDVDPSGSDVAIQSCGINPNGVDSIDFSGPCGIAVNDLTQLVNPITQLPSPINLADGNVHSVTVTYSPSTATNCGPTQTTNCSSIDVLLDNVDLFPGGSVLVNLSTLLTLSSGDAWVGFTASTYAAEENQDILSWTFMPGSQSAVLTPGVPATLTFPNQSGTPEYTYNATLLAPYGTPEITVQPFLMTQAACDQLVDVDFWPARCFVYQNAENSGTNASVVFALTCPNSPNGVCGSDATPFEALLGTTFNLVNSENPFFVWPGIDLIFNPFPGWLKWPLGSNSQFPCSSLPTKGTTSNQIEGFYVDKAGLSGGSGGGGSCWVATYDTPGEIWPGITITSPTAKTYPPNTQVAASYNCSNPSTSQPLTATTGPYLTMNPALPTTSCTQSTGTQTGCTYTAVPGPGPGGGGLACTGTFTTPSKKGLYLFTVTAVDSGGNQNVDAVIYGVN